MRLLPSVTPTDEQLQLIGDEKPGYRLIRGAVGSGKTTTALLCLHQAHKGSVEPQNASAPPRASTRARTDLQTNTSGLHRRARPPCSTRKRRVGVGSQHLRSMGKILDGSGGHPRRRRVFKTAPTPPPSLLDIAASMSSSSMRSTTYWAASRMTLAGFSQRACLTTWGSAAKAEAPVRGWRDRRARDSSRR